MPSDKPSRSKRAPRRAARRAGFPERIFALASPRSIGGVSLFEPGVTADAATVTGFVSEPDLVERAVNLLADAGFDVLQATALMINFAGTKERFESAFATSLVAQERPVVKQMGIEESATFYDSPDTDVPGLIATDGTRFEEVLEGVAIEEPAYPATPTAFPPPKGYFHLDVPADVALGCNADKAHRGGTTGAGVTVAMVDTGWQSHPWFTDRGYRVDPVVLGPGTADPDVDENGHGSGESANVFSTAPDCTLKPVKAATSSGALVNMTAAFNAAVALDPDVITNSWTSDVQTGPLSAAMQARAAAVAAAWAAGIVVVFAAGNGHWGFPGQHPDVISVGGVDIAQDGSLRASDYASGFDSAVYPGRRVPDLSGLVGMRPGAQLIMLPVPEGCALDAQLAGGTHPNGDETAGNDGWAAFSGTSAATPQVAGVCALLKQACAGLAPAEIREILMTTARDVTTGTNHPNFGNPAVEGPDNATGAGLVDAHKAVLLAKLRCPDAGGGSLSREDVAAIERMIVASGDPGR
jgi:subtilisin family serine protease